MKTFRKNLPGALPLALFAIVLSLLTAWLSGNASLPAWLPRCYLPAHIALEVLAAVAVLLILSMGWHQVGARVPATVALLSPAALAVALLGIGQLAIPADPGLAARGIGRDSAAFWLVARSTGALALLAAALVPAGRTVGRAAYRLSMLGVLGLAACAYWLVLVRPGLLPPGFGPGAGARAHAYVLEYALAAMNASAALILFARARRTRMHRDSCLAAAVAVMALSEVNFILYPALGNAFSMAGHLYGALGCLYLYRATLADSGQAPGPRAGVPEAAEQRRLERALAEQRGCDTLTGLPNRQRVLELLGEAIGGARRDGRPLAVVVLGIHGFGKINSGHGWASGDQVMHECVARLSAQLGPGGTLARQGANEFIVVQRGAGLDDAATLAEALLACMRTPFQLDEQRAFLAANAGLAVLPDVACTASQLVQMAEMAMACAQADGSAQAHTYSATMEQAIRERANLETLLYHAIERNEFVLQFQPRVCLKGGPMIGAEALVRWRHPVLGLVPPTRFIPLAEETGMIAEIDVWVMREACRNAATWRAAGLPLGRVSVNLSAQQFQHPGLARRVRAALDESGLDPASLELEITESTVMHDTEDAADVLRSLRALGVRVSIDDFGTGYSSLSYLKRFPLDVLKIDRSFVEDVIGNPTGAAITRAIITLAHSLGLEAVAEGVETAEQMAFLKDNGCDEIQGYYCSRPVWPEQLKQFLMKGSPFAMAGHAAIHAAAG